MNHQSPSESQREASEDELVTSLGYSTQMPRVLRKLSLFAAAFGVVSVVTGLFVNYGFGLAALGPATVWTWPIAAVGQVLVALVLAELSSRIPLAGATYNWGAEMVSVRFGFIAGCFGYLFAILGIPSVLLLGASPLVAYIFGWDVTDERLLVTIALVLLFVAAAINWVSVKLTAKVTSSSTVIQLIGSIVFAVVVVVFWAVEHEPGQGGWGTLSDVVTDPSHSLMYAIAVSTITGAWCLVGMESAADLSEETHDAHKVVPRMILIAVVLSAVLGFVMLVCFTIAIPDLTAISASETPLADIAFAWLGEGATALFLLLVILSMFSVAVIGLAAAARGIWAMARDNVFPCSRGLMLLNKTSNTPNVALLVITLLCAGMMLYGYVNGEAFGTLVGGSTFAPYLVYLLIILAYILRRKTLPPPVDGGFNLGRWSVPVVLIAGIWVAGVLLMLSIPEVFRQGLYAVAVGAVITFAWVLFGLNPRLRNGTAGIGRLDRAEPGLHDDAV